jgi:hypothetical protein
MSVLDERFPRWVESVELGPSSERFTALRAAAESVGRDLTLGAAFDLVAYAVGRNNTSAFETVQAAVSGNDPTFAGVAADLEPHLVATAALARVLEGDDDKAAVVAGAVLSAEFAGLSSPVEELPQLARATLASRFRGLRDRVDVPAAKLENIFRDVPDVAFGIPTPSERVDLLLAATKTLAEQFTRMLGILGQRFETRLDAADEELDMLWWAFAADSMDVNTRWRESYGPAALLRTGLELADRHRFKAEIPSAREILRRALGPIGSEEYSVADVVVAAAADQVDLDAAPPGPLLPILTSYAEYLAFKDSESIGFQAEEAWVISAGRYGVDPTIRRTGDEIATQTLRELLLARAVNS